MTTRKKQIYSCTNCGGTDIQEQAWVEVNTCKIIDMTGIEFYCPDCNSFFKIPNQKEAEDTETCTDNKMNIDVKAILKNGALEECEYKEGLTLSETEHYYRFEVIDEDEEIWVLGYFDDIGIALIRELWKNYNEEK